MHCTGYEMARYKGTQASQLYEKSLHTQCTINEQPLQAEASTILDRSLARIDMQPSLLLHKEASFVTEVKKLAC